MKCKKMSNEIERKKTKLNKMDWKLATVIREGDKNKVVVFENDVEK